MSLTGELRRGDSWVNGYFKDRFPAVVDFVKLEGAAVKSLDTRVPNESPNTARLVGTAFDYRLRMHFEPDFAASKVLLLGIHMLQSAGSGLGAEIDQTWADTTVDLLAGPPPGDDTLAARAGVALAWLDWGFRSGGVWSGGLRDVARCIAKRDSETGWKQYTATVDDGVADEVARIMRLTRPPRAESAECGTSFTGSAFVGGADADLTLDGCLYDVKTTMTPRRNLPFDLRQLIGYTLLDWNDELGLKRVGFSFSRQGKWMSWQLEDVIRRTTGNPTATLKGVREQFRRVAFEHNPRRAEQVRILDYRLASATHGDRPSARRRMPRGVARPLGDVPFGK